MSAWRREAILRLPEHSQHIAAAESPMALWIELSSTCHKGCLDRNDDLVGRIFDYARWTWNSGSDDLRTAVACAFYEHLPVEAPTRRAMLKHICAAEFRELRDALAYLLSPDEMASLEHDFKGRP